MHKKHSTGLQRYFMRNSSLESSSKWGQLRNRSISRSNTGCLSVIFFHSGKQSASEYPNPDSASEWTVHSVLAAGSARNCLTPYSCNWQLEAYKTRLQVSICIHRHMDNKLVSMVRHDSTGKSVFNRWNKCSASIHKHLETTVNHNINFDYSKRNKIQEHYLEFWISVANLFSVGVFLKHTEGIYQPTC